MRPRALLQYQHTSNQRSKYVTQVQKQRPELPTVTLTWHAGKYKELKLHQGYILESILEDIILVEFMYLVFTRKLGESDRGQLRS